MVFIVIHRRLGDAMIFFNFVVIGVKLVLQASTLPVLIRRLRVGKDWSLQEEELDYRESHP